MPIPIKIGERAHCGGKRWKRVTKSYARLHYTRGLPIMYCGVGLTPADSSNNPFVTVAQGYDTKEALAQEFDSKVQQYIDSGNCQDKAGRYPAFYVEV